MQNDLISRSELKNILRPYYDKILDQNISDEEMLAKHDMLSDVMHEINDIPTAYNPGKVVQQLCILRERGYCPNNGSCECVLDKNCSDCYREKVKEIVRNGGKE